MYYIQNIHDLKDTKKHLKEISFEYYINKKYNSKTIKKMKPTTNPQKIHFSLAIFFLSFLNFSLLIQIVFSHIE